MRIQIAPSLLAADFTHLAREVARAEAAGADMLHCDVMDGVYVPNISFGFPVIRQIAKITSLPLDVHMMTSCPGRYIDVLAEIGASIVTVHSDAVEPDELGHTLSKIREAGMTPALALRPPCPAEEILPYADILGMVLVMTVEPGFGGQKFMADMMPKVREVRQILDRVNPTCAIEVDGGIGEATVAEAAEAGANVFVVGTASFRAPDMKEAVSSIREKAEIAFRHGRQIE
ncbi:MAG: ribulose-phosphate 3-epimerase [Clostridia bacterium]|nr:ribulose-phosphate 3-epimerase [Clostridia bacterium]